MKVRKITTGGQVSLPADVRNRWRTHRVAVDDRGDHLVITPMPDDPIEAARGALEGQITTDGLRARARRDDAAAEARR